MKNTRHSMKTRIKVNNLTMKKLAVFLFVICNIVALSYCPYTNLCEMNVQGKYICYSATDVTGSIECDMTEAKDVLMKQTDVAGEAIIIQKQEDLYKILSKLLAKKISSEMVEGMSVEYYYSPRLQNHVVVDGKKVNLMIANRINNIKIGYPLILDSF